MRMVVLSSVIALFAAGAASCSDGSSDSAAKADGASDEYSPAMAAEGDAADIAADGGTSNGDVRPLRILVSNDDGYDAPGIDALVRALAAMPDTEVVVSAPATQQSGTASSVTEGELTASEKTTLSGHPVHVVEGTPADSVNWALDGGIDFEPDLVITGINAGQNLGLIADRISGTIGAARAGTAHGIPALATSLGGESVETVNDPVDIPAFEIAAAYVAEWVKEHRDDLISGDHLREHAMLENLNVPLCSEGNPRGLARVELSESGENSISPQDCTSVVPQPEDDINAFINGFVTLSSVPLEQRAA